MAAILSSITSLVTSAIGWVTSFIGVVTASGNELLLLFVILSLVGLGVGLLSRLIRL